MEHRHELEQVLLRGLPDDERRLTIESMDNARTAKLDRLRNGRPATGYVARADEHSAEPDSY